MEIRELKEDKKQFLSLLLLADEQEDMIDRYIEKGTVYVVYSGDIEPSARGFRATITDE